jgi:hypothetical protein
MIAAQHLALRDACGTKSGLQARPPFFNKLQTLFVCLTALSNRSTDINDLLATLLCQCCALLDTNSVIHAVLCRVSRCGDELGVVLLNSVHRVRQHLGHVEDARAACQHVARERGAFLLQEEQHVQLQAWGRWPSAHQFRAKVTSSFTNISS